MWHRELYQLLAQTAAAIKDYDTRKRKDWLFDHLNQLCIVVTQWAWTRDVEIAFDNMGLGQVAAPPAHAPNRLPPCAPPACAAPAFSPRLALPIAASPCQWPRSVSFPHRRRICAAARGDGRL